MSVYPGGESGVDPDNLSMDFDEESTLDENEALDPVDESSDVVTDPAASIYDTSWVPDDRPSRRTDYGNTLSEMRAGESLDQRLREDEPDVYERELGDPADGVPGRRSRRDDDPNWEEDDEARLATEADLDDPEVEEDLREEGGDTDVPAPEFAEQDPRAGRLVEPDEGLESDTEKDMVAYDAGISGGAASAEEAAVHIVDDAPGATGRD